MTWREFFAAIIEALAWPGTILLAVMLLRPYIDRLPEFLKSARYKDLEVTFREKVKVLESDAESAGLEIPDDLPHQYRELFEQNRNRLHLVVIDAWGSIEKLLRQKFPSYSARTKGATPISVLIRSLYREEVLSEEEYTFLREMQYARNNAAHGQKLDLREMDVRAFLRFTAAFTQRMQEIPDQPIQ